MNTTNMAHRILLFSLTAASGLTLGVWLRSHWVVDSVTIPLGETRFLLLLTRQGVITVGKKFDSARAGSERVSWEHGPVSAFTVADQQMNWSFEEAHRRSGRPIKQFNSNPAFAFRNGTVSHNGRTFGRSTISFPFWIVLLAVAAYPVLIFLRGPIQSHILQRRRRNSRCPTCAYDLTGNTSGRCPECGTEIPAGDSA